MGKRELGLGLGLGVTGLVTACAIEGNEYVLADDTPAQTAEIGESVQDFFQMIPNKGQEIVFIDFGETDPSEVNEKTLYEIADQSLESVFPGFDVRTQISANIGSVPLPAEYPPAPVAALPLAESFTAEARAQKMYNPKSMGLGRATPRHTEHMRLQTPSAIQQPLTHRMQ